MHIIQTTWEKASKSETAQNNFEEPQNLSASDSQVLAVLQNN